MSFIGVSLLPPGSSVLRPRGFDHRLALLPVGMHLNDIYSASTVSGMFLIDPDCGNQVLNDPAFGTYLKERMPVLLCATRARDLRPFLRRADSFRQRGFVLELVP
jgi:hypothetical protein